MRHILLSLLLLSSSPSWAESNTTTNMQLIYDNPLVDMTYPHVSGEYLVYSQRVNQGYQVMRLKRSDLYGAAKDVSPQLDKEAVRNGVALSNGDIAYVSNRLGNLAPWLSQTNRETAIAVGAFQNLLLPNHLDVSSNGKTWIFDTTYETTRYARIGNQFSDGFLHTQLIGQAWRMYHNKFWTIKSSYPASKDGVTNKFLQPHLFVLKRNSNDLNMLGDGFDATLNPDGKSMIFVRENNGNFDLWQQNIDGSELKQLTRNTFADIEPSFSADGKRIAFVSNRDAAGDILQTSIYVLEIATGKIERITQGSNVTDGGPAWLDDKTIIFHSNRDPKAPNTDTVNNWRLWAVSLPK